MTLSSDRNARELSSSAVTYLNKKSSGVSQERPVKHAYRKADRLVPRDFGIRTVSEIAHTCLKICFQTGEVLSVPIPNVRGRGYRVTSSLDDPSPLGFSCVPRPTTREISTAAANLMAHRPSVPLVSDEKGAYLTSAVCDVAVGAHGGPLSLPGTTDTPRFSYIVPEISAKGRKGEGGIKTPQLFWVG